MVSLRPYLASLVLLCGLPSVHGSTNLTDWLTAQSNIQTWSADFVQTRTLKALVQPLKSEGHIWFAAPDRFHWELGRPAQTIAVRTTNALLIIYPKFKRAERYPLSGNETGSWRDMLSLLEAGFPRSKGELESRFHILSISDRDGQCAVVLQPKSSQARRWVREIGVAFNTNNFSLAATELRFSDGSTLRNEFVNSVLNAPVEGSLFSPNIPPDYTVVEPLTKARRP
jgi:outer membrane lipoprotein-sorting protein